MKFNVMHETARRELVTLFASVSAVVAANAASRYFPGEGGDIASAAEWGEAGLPTQSDSVSVNKEGTYTLSEDKTFFSFRVENKKSTVAFGNRTLTAKAPAGSYGLGVITANAEALFTGGIFNLSGTADCRGACDADGIHTIFTNGCVVTNASYMYAAHTSANSLTEIAGGTKVYATSLVVNRNAGHDNTLEIHSGGELHVSGSAHSETEGTAGDYGGERLLIHGADSVFYHDNGDLLYWGYQRRSNLIGAYDHGLLKAKTGIALGSGTTSSGNCLLIDNCATGIVPQVRYRGHGNSVIVSNATLTAERGFYLAYANTASNNLFRAYGSGTVLNLPTPTTDAQLASRSDLFGSWNNNMTVTGRWNTVSLEGGVKWDCGNRDVMMATSHNSTFQLVGAGTTLYSTNDSSFCLGYKGNNALQTSCVSNRLAILDGATFNAKQLLITGIANEICISNATLNLAADDAGLRVGYDAYTTNCMLVMRGETPKVKSAATGYSCVFGAGAKLRFEIPRDGYAADYVPFDVSCQFSLAATASLEVDCDEFVAHTGGKLHLIHAKSINAATAERLTACSLPEGCSIIVDGGDVYLKSKKMTGFVITFH